MGYDNETNRKNSQALAILKEQGYTWFPLAQEWKRSPGLPLNEVSKVPGWYRCAQVKPGSRQQMSWDGYTFITKEGWTIHFNLEMKERKWSPSIGFEDRVCFIPIDIQAEMQTPSS